MGPRSRGATDEGWRPWVLRVLGSVLGPLYIRRSRRSRAMVDRFSEQLRARERR